MSRYRELMMQLEDGALSQELQALREAAKTDLPPDTFETEICRYALKIGTSNPWKAFVLWVYSGASEPKKRRKARRKRK